VRYDLNGVLKCIGAETCTDPRLGMSGVSDKPKKTDTFVTDSDAQCTLIGSVSLVIGAQ